MGQTADETGPGLAGERHALGRPEVRLSNRRIDVIDFCPPERSEAQTPFSAGNYIVRNQRDLSVPPRGVANQFWECDPSEAPLQRFHDLEPAGDFRPKVGCPPHRVCLEEIVGAHADPDEAPKELLEDVR